MARRRTARRPRHAGFTALLVAGVLVLVGVAVGWVGGAAATLWQWDPAVPQGGACLGGLLGALAGVIVYRRMRR
jgi:hypothetical protein